MAVEVIDLSNYRDRFGSRVAEGEHLVQVEEIEVGESSKKDPMWTVYLRVIGGENDGATIVDRLTQTEKAMFRVVGFLHGMGVKTARKRLRVDTDRLVGRKVRVQVSDGEPYNGTIRSEVRGYTRYVSIKAEDEVDELDQLEDGVDESAEETPKAPAKAKAKSKPKPEPVEDVEEGEAEDAPETSDDDDIDLDDLDI